MSRRFEGFTNIATAIAVIFCSLSLCYRAVHWCIPIPPPPPAELSPGEGKPYLVVILKSYGSVSYLRTLEVQALSLDDAWSRAKFEHRFWQVVGVEPGGFKESGEQP